MNLFFILCYKVSKICASTLLQCSTGNQLYFLLKAQHAYELLFISVCDLFNDIVSISDYTVSGDRMI
jgi:hypothetical protein